MRVRAARAEKWDRWDEWECEPHGQRCGTSGAGGMRGLWGERIGERRVNDIIFCSFAFYS